ncbi:XdhC family protein [Microbacterium sp. cx-59]|uniref:XdhC family protein n=1 Tax=Microbacterium sp. cx-59 TaxID=2891207 RepID=UPI001E3FE5DE|nr:XdhC/CoxI family protein [Microbacterium sp. cx-59]MCC4908552.1 XdhC family protein [Microbacterium sp. cx-59]
MLELARDLLPLLRAGETVATVTVTGVARSAPRGVGSAMAVTRDARVIGSISGGCVEADAVALSLATLAGSDDIARGGRRGIARSGDTRSGTAASFGFSDDQAFAAGLACGGSIDAVISVLRPDDHVAIDALERAAADRRSSVGIVAAGPRAGEIVALQNPAVPDAAPQNTPAQNPTVQLTSGQHTAAPHTSVQSTRGQSALTVDASGTPILVVVSAPRPRLLLMGAGEHAAALSRIATSAGFAVTVCDVWELLVTPERFPDAHELHTGMPHEYLAALGPDDIDERTAVVVLTHDVRLDIPALQAALALPIGFVGALGARSTVARRADLLRDAGVPDADIARLHSPLGLDLGGATPDETAVAAIAEIVAARHGGSGRPLGELRGPLHRRPAAPAGVVLDAASSTTAQDAPSTTVGSAAAFGAPTTAVGSASCSVVPA